MEAKAIRASFRGSAGVLATVALLGLWPVMAGAGQVQQVPGGMPPNPHPTLPGINDAEPNPGLNSEKLEHMREDDRRKRLLSDTAKLVALSNELNDEVQKTSKDELSIEVVRKAEEIEKLAHDVKERMKS